MREWAANVVVINMFVLASYLVRALVTAARLTSSVGSGGVPVTQPISASLAAAAPLCRTLLTAPCSGVPPVAML